MHFALSAAAASLAQFFSRSMSSLIIVLCRMLSGWVINYLVTANGFEVILVCMGESGAYMGSD